MQLTTSFLFLSLAPFLGERAPLSGAATAVPSPGATTTTVAAPLALRGPSLHWGDFDRDGQLDVFVATPGGSDRLFRNEGSGALVDVTRVSGLESSDGSRAATWFDADGDGDLDLFTASDASPSRLWSNDGAGVFTDVTRDSGLASEAPDLDVATLDFDGDGRLDLQRVTAQGDRLFRNLGKGRFEELGLAQLLAGASGTKPTPTPKPAPGPKSAPPTPPVAGAAGGGQAAASSSGPIVVSTTLLGPATLASASFACAGAVEDMMNPGTCIPVSTVPAFGTIYPLGLELNIDAAGQVGMGTVTPGAKLDVVGDIRANGQLKTTYASGPPLEVQSTTKVANLNVDLLDGKDSSVFTQLGTSISGSEIDDGTITGFDLENLTVTADKLGVGSVGPLALQGNSVSSSVLQDNSVTGVKIASSSITATHLATNSVGALEIASSAVGASEIATNAVGASEIAAQAVSTSEIKDGAVTTVKLADDAVTNSKIAAQAVGSAEIANFSIESLDFASPMARSTGGALLSLENTTTLTQGKGLYATTGASGGVAVEALATNTGNGVAYGVKGLSASGNGVGVWGRTNSTGIGVKGEALNGDAQAVYGSNTATTGWAEGVRGESSSTSGRAIYGRHLAQTGNGQAVRGWTASPTGYGVYSSGDFGGTGAKFFIQPHPTDASKQINFVCLEGNESGTYFRGSSEFVQGSCVIEVPEDFRLVTDTDGLTVQVTVVGAPAQVWVESQDLESIVVRSTADVEFHYMVNGVRRGFGDLETIRDNMAFVPSTRGVPYGTQYPAAMRQLLVENRILNADFTPNEAMAAARGWVLEDSAEGRIEE